MSEGDAEDEFRDGFHDRLARDWPEPREQLHAGGWAETRWLVDQLEVVPGERVLDACCGEGGSAVWLAHETGARVAGIDIVRAAVRRAIDLARSEGESARCSFVRGDLLSLPFAAGSIDVVLGQDADGFAHRDRERAFRECHRVLGAGGRLGIEHWILAPGAPPEIERRFDRMHVEAGYASHAHVNADAYVDAMRRSGFEEVRAIDRSSLYHAHMSAIRDRARDRGEQPDAWTEEWLAIAREHPLGVALIARKS